jgi:hypothetical protein
MVASSFVEGDDCIGIISTAAVTGNVRTYKTGHPWKDGGPLTLAGEQQIGDLGMPAGTSLEYCHPDTQVE